MGDEARGRSAARRRQRHLVVGKTKVAVGLAQQGDEARDFALHVLLAAEYMRIVLLEGARPHDAVERTGRLIAVTSGELGIADRKLPPRAQPLVEDLHVARAAPSPARHRRPGTCARRTCPSGRCGPRVPLAAAVASGPRRSRLGASCAGHSPPDRKAARMPEHHARRIFLKVPEFGLHAEISVVEIVHGCRSRRN
jgi:hypothetical protein